MSTVLLRRERRCGGEVKVCSVRARIARMVIVRVMAVCLGGGLKFMVANIFSPSFVHSKCYEQERSAETAGDI